MDTDQQQQNAILPKQARSRHTRARIFRAAERVFSQKGLAGARVEEIARRARVNKQRLYAYFGSKQELYRQVLVAVYSKAAANERLLALSPDDIGRMTGVIIDTFFEIHETEPEFWRLLCWENLNGGRGLGMEDWRHIRSTYIEHLEELYLLGQKRAIFRRDVDFSTYLMLLFSTTYFYFSNQLTMSHLLGLELSSGEVRQRIERELLAVMTEGVEARAGTDR